MPRPVADLSESERHFLIERHLGTLTTLRKDGSPHVVAIAFTYDDTRGMVQIICTDKGQKVRNIERDARATVCQVEGRRWLALEGDAAVTRDPEHVAAAVEAFESRYRPARENPDRVAIEITIRRVLGRA